MPKKDHKEILNSVSSTINSHFFQIKCSVLLNEHATFSLNSKNSSLVPVLAITMDSTAISNGSLYLIQPSYLQPIQVLCVPVSTRGRYLHSTFMSYKSTGLFFNPTSSLLNLI